MIDFIYNGKTYSTENLDKKLKRLKIKKEDIQIIREYNPIKQNIQDEYPDWYYCYFYNPITKYSHIVVSKDHVKPKNDILYNLIYNPETKTSCKEYTKEYIDNLILLDGKPIFPIVIDENTKLPKLEKTYDWK